MGNPLHFSAELPQRCLQLINELWPYVEKTHMQLTGVMSAYDRLDV
jgi:hypothetical protein